MGLFDKKYCDVCGEKIGLLGNRKLDDGNLCKNCAKKLSPFFEDRRHTTVEEIKEQLAYREANQEKVDDFHPTKVLGAPAAIYIDEDKKQWFYSRKTKWKEENPDVLDFSQVTGCNLDIDESRTELYRTNAQGEKESYHPPRYRYEYNFYLTIHVNSPWFQKIKFKVNDSSIEGDHSGAYQMAKRDADEMIQALLQMREQEREIVNAATAPKMAVVCPYCNATTMPDANGCCEYCGSPIK